MADKGSVEVIQNGKEAALEADTVITMLPGPNEVKDVYLSPDTGILAGANGISGEKLFLECGTIDPDVIVEVGKVMEEYGAAFFCDTPVSGDPGGANKGTPSFMAGCKEEADGISHCGDVGSGEVFKILNNYVSGIIGVAISEACNIGIKAGADPHKLTNVIQASGGQTWMMENCNPVPGLKTHCSSSRGYTDGFRVELCTKVFKMATRLAKEVGAKTILSESCEEGYQVVCNDDKLRGLDARVIYK